MNLSIDAVTFLNAAFILLQFSKFYLAFTYLFKEKINPVWLLGIYVFGLLICGLAGPLLGPLNEALIYALLALGRTLLGPLKERDLRQLGSYAVLSLLDLSLKQLVGQEVVAADLVFEAAVALTFVYLLLAPKVKNFLGNWPDKAKWLLVFLEILALGAVSLTAGRFQAYLRLQKQLPVLEACLAGAAVWLDMALLQGQFRVWKLEGEMSEQEQLLQAEENYYESLLAREKETKKFRHDARQHLVSLQGLAHAGQYQELTAYIDDLVGSSQMTRQLIDTGNSGINAVIGDLAARYPQVEISWTGVIPGNLALRQLDLCIIAGNLLKNACQAASLATDHQVKAVLKFSGKTMLLTVLNQTEKKVKIGPEGDNVLESGRVGIGLGKVKSFLEPYHGRLRLTFSPKTALASGGGEFRAEVFVPNALEAPREF
ncbi:Conserved domain protein [Lactobacillus equicursoris 66c]|uniref:Conserved domain protein n=1 Tax=Lactobacillus equicursoris 66c TaxID=872326 RepID=K0NV99_9LACO|nr:GHKL domain-containing protein [Lactobacillus equicursoris]CCK84536.1 Conserved domain protein [Lactobacillus equicursoris 66c]